MAWLYLVRHGETFDNAARRVQGWAPGKLTPRGIAQAKALARKLAAKRVDSFYSSQIARARETAEIISRAIGKQIVYRGELNEIDVGDVAGLTFEEIEREYDDVLTEVFSNPVKRFPNGESLHAVHDRVMPFIESVFHEDSSEKILIVAHNVVNRVVLASLAGLPLSRCRVFKQYNACLNIASIRAGEGVRLHLVNEPALPALAP